MRLFLDAVLASTWLHVGSKRPPKSRLGNVLGRLRNVLERLRWSLGASSERLGIILERLNGASVRSGARKGAQERPGVLPRQP